MALYYKYVLLGWIMRKFVHYSDEEVRVMKEMRDAGATFVEIGKAIGRTSGSVGRAYHSRFGSNKHGDGYTDVDERNFFLRLTDDEVAGLDALASKYTHSHRGRVLTYLVQWFLTMDIDIQKMILGVED